MVPKRLIPEAGPQGADQVREARGDQAQKLRSAAAHSNAVPVPSAVGLHRGQRGPWQVWEEPHSQGGPGWGRKRSGRREQECGHLTEPLLLGPTLTNTRYGVVETHSPWQGAKWLERTQPWLSSGRLTFERPLHQETLRLGTKTGLPTGPISDATAPQPADTSPSSRITGEPSLQKFPHSRPRLPHVGNRNEKPLGPLERKHARGVSRTPRLVPAAHSSLFFAQGKSGPTSRPGASPITQL